MEITPLGRSPRESYTEQVHLVNNSDLNGFKRLFGGILLSWIDSVAGIVAMRHAGMNVTTVAIDNLEFILPAHANDMVVLCGRVTWTGNTSLEVSVDSYVEKRNGERNLINRAHLVMVAIDENERPAKVPPLIPETDEERAEFAAGEKRRELRRARARENF